MSKNEKSLDVPKILSAKKNDFFSYDDNDFLWSGRSVFNVESPFKWAECALGGLKWAQGKTGVKPGSVLSFNVFYCIKLLNMIYKTGVSSFI